MKIIGIDPGTGILGKYQIVILGLDPRIQELSV